MRHLLSLLLAVVLAPVIFLASGYGTLKFNEAVERNTLTPTLLAAAAIVVAGACYSILILARISPVGPVLAGLALLGVVVWAMVDAGSFLDATPDKLFGVDNLLTAPVSPTAVFAIPLVLTVFSPRRWRRHAVRPAGGAGPLPASPTPDTAPTYSPSYSPAYTPPASTPYSPYPASTSSGGLGGGDTKVDDLGSDDTLASPKYPDDQPSSPYGSPPSSSPYGSPPSSPYGTPPVPNQPSSPENYWPRS